MGKGERWTCKILKYVEVNMLMNGNSAKQGVKRNVYKHIETWAGEMARWLRTVMIFTFRSALSSQVVGKQGRWDILVAGVLAAASWMSCSVSILTKS